MSVDSPPEPPPLTPRRLAAGLLLGLLGLVAWDVLPLALDLRLARVFGDAQGFALRDNWWLSEVLHEGARRAGWVLVLGLVLMIRWPLGILRRLRPRERAGLVLGLLAAMLVVSLLKGASRTSCPWDLSLFGGTAQHLSHWRWGVPDGGGGHCFPAGHASTGFAFAAGWFWLRTPAPRAARTWLVASLVIGLVLGLAQQVRGAHFMSHTLWTAWLCLASSGLAWLALRRWAASPAQRPASATG